jgi:hypothetical protein
MNKTNGNYFEYVLSGPSYTRITYQECVEDPNLNAWVHRTLNKMNTETNHKFSFLYNAWTEKEFGSTLVDYKKSTNSLYTDSGGLQIVTRGMTATPEIKKEVYVDQAKFSDLAMSFDEIPVSIAGEKSTRLDTSNRWFDKTKFEECARQTGRNIDQQIEHFLESKSDTKPVAIVQGNCYDTYMKWCEYMISEIAPSRRDYIGGIAMGAASFGHGFLEDIQRAYYFTQLPFKTTESHCHFLAVGSIERILPAVIFAQTGVYSDTRISYDSTSHASAMLYGRMFLPSSKGNYVNFTRVYDKTVYTMMYDAIDKEFDLGFSVDDFHYFLNNPSGKVKEARGDRINQIKTFVAGSMMSVICFMRELDRLVLADHDQVIKKMGKSGKANVFSSLYEIKTFDDFKHWDKHFSRYIPSERIPSSLVPPNILDL